MADSSKPSIERPPAPRARQGAGDRGRSAQRGGEAPARALVGEPGDRARRTAGRWSGASSSPPPGRWATSRSWSTPSRAASCAPGTCSSTRGRATRKLYNPNPVVENSGSSGLRSDHNGTGTPGCLTALRRPVTLPNIRGGQHCLRGKWVHAKLGRDAQGGLQAGPQLEGGEAVEGPLRGADDLLPHRSRPALHPATSGSAPGASSGINDRTQVAVADAFRDDNSFYSPATRRIKYGSGGVDDAEDADVILHEYGHAMQDDQVRGFGHRQTRPERSARASATTGRPRCPPGHRARATRTTSASSTGTATTWGSFVPAVRPEVRPARGQQRHPGRGPGPAASSRSTAWARSGRAPSGTCATRVGGKSLRHGSCSPPSSCTRQRALRRGGRGADRRGSGLDGGANQAAICAEMETQRGISVGDCP